MRNGGIIFAILLIVAATVFLGRQAYIYNKSAEAMAAKLNSLEEKLLETKKNNSKMEQERNFIANPENLEKIMREKGNWKKEGEQMIIVAPAN
jgi:hypothetical protein